MFAFCCWSWRLVCSFGCVLVALLAVLFARLAVLLFGCVAGLMVISVGCSVACRIVLVCNWLMLDLLLGFVALRVFWMLFVGCLRLFGGCFG